MKIAHNLSLHPNWEVFHGICHEWTEPESFLNRKVRNIWLEFDIDGQNSQIPVPCILFELNQQTLSHSQELIDIAYKLFNQQFSLRLESNLLFSINSLPGIHYLGAMLSRSNQAIRIVTNKITPDELLNYLVKIGWEYPTDTLESLVFDLSEFVDYICLICDVGETILPRIGLECFLHKQPKDEPRWQLFLDYLVSRGLGAVAKKNAVLSWTGFCQKASQPEPWPENLTWGDYFLGARALSVFSREISHVKIVYQPNDILEAKVYLWFGHSWVNTDIFQHEISACNS